MANDARASRKGKGDESNDSKGKNGSEKSTSSSAAREATSTSLSASATRRSGRLENRMPATSVTQKPEANQSHPSPLRRSERGKKQPSSSSSTPKKSDKSESSSSSNKKKRKEKSVRQLTRESKEIDTIERPLPRKRMDAVTYASFFKPNVRKAVVAVEMTNSLSQDFRNKNGDVGKDCNQVEVVNSRQEDGGRIEEIKLNEPNASDGKPQKQGDSVDQPDIAFHDCTPIPSTKISGQSAKISGREQDNLLPELFSVDNETSGGNGLKSCFKVSSKRKKPTDCPEEKCATCFKRPRVAHDSEQQNLCCCSTELNYDLCGTSLSKDRGETGDTDTRGFTEHYVTNLQHKESSVDFQFDGNLDICDACKRGENLLSCDGRGCGHCYHLSCLDPPLKAVPPGIWHCPTCVMKKLESGVYSVSKGIESIWDVRELELTNENGLGRQRQFLVKYKGLAHAHNNWVPESKLLLEAPALLASFNPDDQDSRWKPEWAVPHHFLQKRLVTPPKHYCGHLGENVESLFDCQYEWLVKWCCLGYEHATWELDAATFMSSPEAVSLKNDYETRHEKGNTTKCLQAVNKKAETMKDSVVKLSAGVSSGFDNSYLDIVNNLLDHWQKKQNAVVTDDQERIVKVISFISSLSSRSSWPFLVLTTSSALNLWDEELFHLAPSIYSVTYCGSKDLRKAIRTLEFYDEAGGIMFQLLVTLPEVVIEDVSVFESINWEAVIVDECQDARIYSHFEEMKMLSTRMKLLFVKGHLEDAIIEQLLSLLDFQTGLTGSHGAASTSSRNIGHLKERLSRYICKFDSSRFIEYWVPAQMSNMQLEQYCATLLSNSSSLCSSSKSDPVGALRDMLITARKCCNHPYTVDSCLQSSLIEAGKVKVIDMIDTGVKASGKLHLLDALLSEIRKKGLKVLVLFQSSIGSGRDSIGDILDDIVRHRFGQDSYERVEGGVLPSRKQEAVNNFNNQSGVFVFLLETRSCTPSIKLSSVDTVIIFDSDWNPVSDVRNLQKITLDSPSEKIKVFRLYSSYTAEEKVLILAKHGKTVDIKLQSVSPITSHMLLMWGATHLFRKLSEFHSSSHPGCIESMLEQGFLNDVIQEFLMILPQTCSEYLESNSKIIKVTQRQGSYINNYLLHGELESQLISEEPPHIFWKKLLEGKKPRWNYLSGSSQRNRKRVQRFDESSNKLDVNGDEAARKRKKVANNSTDPPHLVSSSAENCGASTHNTSQSLPKTAEHAPSSPCLDRPCARTDLHDSQKSLHHLLNPKTAELCEILHLPEDVKDMAGRFLEYVMNNHRVPQEPATILQAFQISLCWTAASLLKHQLDHTKSLALAKQNLDFNCKKEEADFVYSMLRCLKRIFLFQFGSVTLIGSPPSQLLVPDHTENHLHAKSLKTTVGYAFTDDEVLSNLGLAQKDFCKSIKNIEKKCDKQLKRLLQRQQEENEDFERKYTEEKARLEHKQKTEAAVIRLHINSSMRTDKLKLLDSEYAKKFEELKFETEANRKDLMEMQLLARNKLKEKEARWVEGVKSWARIELVNKPPPTETGHNSCFEDKVPQRAQSMRDGEVCLEIPGTLRSDEDEQVSPAVQTVLGHAPDGVSSTKLHGEVPSVPKDTGLDDSSINYNPAHTHSLKERAPTVEAAVETPEIISCSDMDITILNPLPDGSFVDGAVRQVSHRGELPLGTPEIVSSRAMEKVASVDPLSTRVTSCTQDEVLSEISESAPYDMDGSTIRQTDRNAMTSQQNGEEEILSDQVEVCSAGLLWKEAQEGENAAKQVYESSDKTKIAYEQDGKFPSINLDTSPAVLVVGSDTGRCQEPEVLAYKAADNEDSQSSGKMDGVHVQGGRVCIVNEDPLSDKMAVINCQNVESFSGVAVARSEQGEGCSAGLQQFEEIRVDKNAASEDYNLSDKAKIGNQQDEDLPSIETDTAPGGVLVGSKISNGQDGEALTDKAADIEGSQSTAMEDSIPQDQMQQTQVSPHLAHNVVSHQSSGAPVMEHVLPGETPLAGSVTHVSGSGTTPTTSASGNQVSPDLAHNVVSAQSSGVPVMEHVLSAETPLDGSVTHVSSTGAIPTTSARGTHPAHTIPLAQMPIPSFQDPLQHELDRIRNEADSTITTHEDTKLQKRLDCEKKIEEAIAQIRRQYEIEVQELEVDFLAKKKELDTNYTKVLMNKILADAFRSKCMDFRGSATPGKQQESTSNFMQQLLHLSSQPTAQRPSVVAGVSPPSTAGTLQSTTTPCPPATGPRGTSPRLPEQPTTQRPSIVASRMSSPGPPGFFQTTAAPAPPAARPHGTSPRLLVQPTTQRPSIVAAGMPPSVPPGSLQTNAAGPRSTAPRPQAVHSQSLFSGTTPARPPHIGSVSPAANNLLAGSEIRAPPPHMQFRSPVSMRAPGLSSLSRGLPSSQVPSNTTATSPPLPPGVSSLSHVQVHGNPPTVSPVLLSGGALSPGFHRPHVPVNPSTTPILPQHQSKVAPSILVPSDLQHRAHLHESVGLSRPQPVSAVELPIGVEDKRTNPTQVSSLPLPTDLGSNSQPSAVADHNQPNATRTNQVSPKEVLCLSDDE